MVRQRTTETLHLRTGRVIGGTKESLLYTIQAGLLDNKAYVAAVFALVVLIGVAMWQFFSLVRGDAVGSRYTVGVQEPSMGQTQVPAARSR
jgi:hypothetical protein